MTQIDWSKAPEGATHYHPRTERYTDHWIKPGHFCVVGLEGKGWVSDFGRPVMKLAVQRPVEPPTWTADGLPPVGIEVLTTHGGRDFKVKILAYAPKNGKQAVMVEETEPGDNRGCLFAWMAYMCTFRPIRTAEQAAADEAKARRADLATVIETGGWRTPEILAAYLDSHGYRKVGQ